MKQDTAAALEAVIDDALLSYTQLRFIDDSEVADFKKCFFNSLQKFVEAESSDEESIAVKLKKSL